MRTQLRKTKNIIIINKRNFLKKSKYILGFVWLYAELERERELEDLNKKDKYWELLTNLYCAK